ncbi:MAG: DUF455 family protein [Verrucomicrobiota bacterium]
MRAFAERIVFGTSLAEKLADPGPLTDERPGPAVASPDAPGRPAHLRFKARQGSGGEGGDTGFPGLRGLDTDVGRGRVLHFFANHELLAVELMALALLRFPDAPPAFRMGVLHTLRDEQRHASDYIRRMDACGVAFGELPVSGHLWRLLAPMPTPLDYVSGLPLTFEQANLDHSLAFGRAFAEAGDAETAALLQSIHRDEIAHVAHGLKWFRRWKDPALEDWEAFRDQLRFPLSPSRAKGPDVDEGSRRAAGLGEVFIRQLRVHGQSRGRAPAVHWFNPFAEHAIAGLPEEALPAVRRTLAQDLETLPVGLARQDDVVLVREEPSLEFLESLRAAGVPVPEFDVVSGGRIRAESNLRSRAVGALRPWAWGPDAIQCLGPLADRLPAGSRAPPSNFRRSAPPRLASPGPSPSCANGWNERPPPIGCARTTSSGRSSTRWRRHGRPSKGSVREATIGWWPRRRWTLRGPGNCGCGSRRCWRHSGAGSSRARPVRAGWSSSPGWSVWPTSPCRSRWAAVPGERRPRRWWDTWGCGRTCAVSSCRTGRSRRFIGGRRRRWGARSRGARTSACGCMSTSKD